MWWGVKLRDCFKKTKKYFSYKDDNKFFLNKIFAMSENFEIQKTENKARVAILKTRRGNVQTPFFMTVATRGAVKGAVSMDDLNQMEAPVLLGNTYHLALRPGDELIAKSGGLHNFIKWEKPILTDSGGFQVFSLKRKKITDEGVKFQSHIDGAEFFLSPEESIKIQHNLGSDIIMAFDECPPNIPNFHKIRQAVERTTLWAKRSYEYHFSKFSQDLSTLERPQIFGIVQGGSFPKLREKSLNEITAMPFDGFAFGGLAVGEPTEKMYEVLAEFTEKLPADKPRYLMGVGTPQDLLEAISRGIDMFDCVMPMRNARHGTIFTSQGILKIGNQKFSDDLKVIDENCQCEVCAGKKYSRAYLRHLLKVGEPLGARLLTIHNLHFYHNLMRTAREKILIGEFEVWKKELLEKFKEGLI